MTTETTQREAVLTPEVAARLASFRRDPPLHTSFPLQLANGATVPEFTATCGCCGNAVDPDWVHGHILESTPTVRTLEASAYCRACQRLIPLNGRFRAVGGGYHFEFQDLEGAWRKVGTPASGSPAQRFFAKLGSLFNSRQ